MSLDRSQDRGEGFREWRKQTCSGVILLCIIRGDETVPPAETELHSSPIHSTAGKAVRSRQPSERAAGGMANRSRSDTQKKGGGGGGGRGEDAVESGRCGWSRERIRASRRSACQRSIVLTARSRAPPASCLRSVLLSPPRTLLSLSLSLSLSLPSSPAHPLHTRAYTRTHAHTHTHTHEGS